MLPVQNAQLEPVEAQRLDALEGVIERGLATFVEVGEALMEIRDSRLYRESHGTFEDYCRERWSFNDRRASQFIQAAEVSKILERNNLPAPKNDSQARELAPLLREPERLRETWAEVVELHEKPTAKDVREVVRSKMGVHYSSATDLWATPQDFFDALHAEFGFTLDVCATADNAKCSRYFTEADDGLSQEWSGTCWMNPPYGDGIGDWMKKAHDSSEGGATVVCLVPARVDTGWWWNHARYGEVRFLRGRLKFGDGANSAPFPSAVVVFKKDAVPATVYWER